MHCCNWAVLSSITLVSVSSRRPRKALSEADFHGAPLAPGTRSYIVAGAVTKSPHLLSSVKTERDALRRPPEWLPRAAKGGNVRLEGLRAALRSSRGSCRRGLPSCCRIP